MIEVKNLSKKYGNHMAVDNLSFSVGENLIYGFLGPNGAGKSTTMNIMTGFIAPTKGTILINGVDILTDPEACKAQIGYLPEQPPVYMDMTVREYLWFVAELKRVPAKKRMEQIQKIEEMTELKDVENRLIKNLSKGYRQRVGLAQAIIGFPPIIILDEPMVGLDPKQIIEIRDLIKKLKENHTVILSSHILSEISAVCDEIMIISHGKLVAMDTPEKLLESNTTDEEFVITAKCCEAKAGEILSAFDDVTVAFTNSTDTLTTFSIKGKTAENRAEKLFFAFADAKTAIVEMHHNTSSLEDIFLELTDVDDDDDFKDDETEETTEGVQVSENEEGTSNDSHI